MNQQDSAWFTVIVLEVVVVASFHRGRGIVPPVLSLKSLGRWGR